MKRSMAWCVMGLMLTAAAVWAGPFGLTMGQALEGLEVERIEGTTHMFSTFKPPKPHSAFLAYVLVAPPQTGLCQIRAISKLISSSVYGTEFLAKFDQIQGQIARAYGSFSRHDFLRHDSIWDEPKDWMSGLRKKERVLQTSWNRESGAVLKDGITGILLAAKADSSDEGQLFLQYSFSNTELCLEILNNAESDAF